MNLPENAITVLTKRYLQRNEAGDLIETPEDLFRRVSSAVSMGDKKWEDTFFNMMTSLDFLPNSPTLMNAGRPLGQLSACFVLPVEDSLDAIFETIKNAALIHQSGGGTGFAFSRLRPAGASVRSTGGAASGPISFMRVFNAATEAVKQGGKRRGANMGVLRVDHPDIMEFIHCKSDTTQFQNFNISVGLTQDFMDALEKNASFDLIDPHTKLSVGSMEANVVFDAIVKAAWATGEPGLLFLDRINKDNPVPDQGEIEATNPCGEQPLLPFEACNLGSINLKNMVTAAKKPEIDWEKLDTTVEHAVRFLDNVIEINQYPLPKIAQTALSTRKIGLGVMGFADLLLLLGIPYNSEEAVSTALAIMERIQNSGAHASEALAKQRGAFPLFDSSKYLVPRRNATVTTIAPTGTISMIAGISSGVEPIFAYSYTRHVMDGTVLTENHPILAQTLEQYNVETIKNLPPEIQKIFVSAHEIAPIWHVKIQEAFQRFTDNAVSKTVNFSKDATEQQVREVFELAYTTGCKGVTIYRDGSRSGQVLVSSETQAAAAPKEQTPNAVEPRPRSRLTTGITERVDVGCGHLYITINRDEQGICEVFTNTGKHGGCPSQSEATARLASVALRAGVDIQSIIRQLRGIRCPSTIRNGKLECLSCPDAIARALERSAGLSSTPLPKTAISEDKTPETISCPECGQPITHESGCVICHSCGFSLCS
jgi:ribonucleoside-diphosphate reductase alpha chain